MNKNCNDYSELLSAYADGELSPSEEEILMEHLSSCENCRATLNLLKDIHMAAGELEETAPENLIPNVMRSIKSDEKRNRRFSLSNFKFTAVTAAILIIAIAAGKLPISETQTETVEGSVTHDAVQVEESAASHTPAVIAPASGSQNSIQNGKQRAISTESFEKTEDSSLSAQESEIPYSRDFSFYILIEASSVPDIFSDYPVEIHRGNSFIVIPASQREAIISSLSDSDISHRIVEGSESENDALVMITH